MKLYYLGGNHYINLNAIAEIEDNNLRMMDNDEWYILEEEQIREILDLLKGL